VGFDDSVSADSSKELVEIGVVGRPHGVDGKIRVYLHNRDSAALAHTKRVFLDEGEGAIPHVIADIRTGPQAVLVRFEEIDNRSRAEAIKGARVLVARDDLPEVAPDEFYVADIIGLEAWNGLELIGQITSSRPQGRVEVVTVRGDGFEMEIPLVEDFVDRLDIAAGRIQFHDIGELPRADMD
jgi:16S rRNA processing protein RimM